MEVHRQTFAVRDLATQVVTLYPSRAHVVRSIEELTLEPGSNEIAVSGITPTADESSIKIEGTGSATITDMTVDLVNNQEHFEDVYPSDSEDLDDSDSDSDSSPASDTETQSVKDLDLKIEKIEKSVKEATEQRNSAQGRLGMLDNYARSLTSSRPDSIAECVESYRTERARAFEDFTNGEARLRPQERELMRTKGERRKLLLKLKKQKAKAERSKTKDQKKKDRENQKAIDEKRRIREECKRFWPRKVYKVVLHLDANSGLTPASSRRASLDSIGKTPYSKPANERSGSNTKTTESCKIKLSFSYITYSASWSPRYDLALDTTTKSGSITYRAEFRNTTSETWRDAKVVLSTSHTTFQGLGEPIPEIQPWHIRLVKGFGEYTSDDALFSRSEQDGKNRSRSVFGQKPQAPRNSLFGIQKSSLPPPPAPGASNSNLFGPWNGDNRSHTQSRSQAFGRSGGGGGGGGLFGSTSGYQPPPPSGSLFGAPAGANPLHVESIQAQTNVAAPMVLRQQRVAPLADEEEADIDDETLAPTEAALAFQESSWEESGLTATYSVPGTKTIGPSETTRRHKIASIPLTSIALSHIIVPKLRSAAFLKARLRNGSSTTLLKGPAGLTLDGTFLGNTTLPRSSPGEAFVLNLGVDPALNVVYGKPKVRRSESGVFQKEGSCIYSRSCTLTNTKNDTTIEATVLDQVPISEDDKLKVEILVPRGLGKEGDQVMKAGVGQINEGTGKKGSTYAESSGMGKGEGKWGKASAKLKKEGEIEWDVKLNPGQGVKLDLEYEARFPSGTGLVGV
ncbi:MAG: hypothetical protein Q9220_004694 [cf. Caloplaca sp. 1 TL-2023]